MAYSFNGTSQYLSTASSPITSGTGDVTVAGFFNTSALTANSVISSIDEAVLGDGRYILDVGGAVAGDPIRARSGNASVIRSALSSAGASSGVTGHAAGTFSGTSSRAAFMDGGSKGTNTDAHSFTSNPNTIRIGAVYYTNPPAVFQAGMNGLLSEIAIWNVALTDDEITSLAKGFKPQRIRPQSLVFYAPLIRTLQDTRGGLTITNNNSATVADHPRVY